jgi:hypothetical protein
MTIDRCAVFAFMAGVTCYLLGKVFMTGGNLAELVVYGATAAIGMEFLISYWRSLWADRATAS